MSDNIDPVDLLSTAGQEICAKLERVRNYQHRTAVGDAREDVIRDYFSESLTGRFDVSKGKVFDSTGRLSKEFDLIISERADCPPGLLVAGRRMLPVESVLGIIEIKSKLTKDGTLKFMDAIRELEEFQRFYVQKKPLRQNLTEKAEAELNAGLRPTQYFPHVSSVWTGMVAVEAGKTETVANYLVDAPAYFTFLCVQGREVFMRGSDEKLLWMPFGDSSVPQLGWMIAQLTSESFRSDVYTPDYGRYRTAFMSPFSDSFRFLHKS